MVLGIAINATYLYIEWRMTAIFHLFVFKIFHSYATLIFFQLSFFLSL